MGNGMVESRWFPVLVLILLMLSAGCLDRTPTQEQPSGSLATQTPKGLREARACAWEWVIEASENAPGMETWQGASVGEPTAYTGSAGQASVLVFPVMKDDEEVGYVTIDTQAGRCTPLESGLGPPPSSNLPEAREMAAERLGTTADDLGVRLMHLEPMVYLAEFTGPDGEEITFNLQPLREYPESQ
jgi:hypothetical protein